MGCAFCSDVSEDLQYFHARGTLQLLLAGHMGQLKVRLAGTIRVSPEVMDVIPAVSRFLFPL